MKSELISIIVPVYNAEKYLKDCIESVLKQTYQNFELLLIDDGSTDKSSSICDEYANKYENISVTHKENGGISSARNAGLDRINGQYVMFLDDDDCLTPDCLEVLRNGLIEHNVDIASGLTVNSKYPWNYEDIIIWRGIEGLEESLKDNPLAYTVWAKLYSAQIIGDTRFRDGYHEDTFFIFELLVKQPTFIGLHHELYFYRDNPDSYSHAAFSEKYFDILKKSEEKYAIIKNRYPMCLALAENMKLKAKMCFLRLLAVRTNGEYKQLEKELKTDIILHAKYYQAGIPSDDRWMFIIKHHLYPLYALVKRKIKKTNII